jgi:hypothetical protein
MEADGLWLKGSDLPCFHGLAMDHPDVLPSEQMAARHKGWGEDNSPRPDGVSGWSTGVPHRAHLGKVQR